MMGISKNELLSDYYMDEIGWVIQAWNERHNPDKEWEEKVDAMTFLGSGGEWLE